MKIEVVSFLPPSKAIVFSRVFVFSFGRLLIMMLVTLNVLETCCLCSLFLCCVEFFIFLLICVFCFKEVEQFWKCDCKTPKTSQIHYQ